MLLDATLFRFNLYLTKMKISLIVVFFCTSALQVSAVVQVTGHVGGDLSIQCFSHGSTNGGSSELYNMYFCKGACSKETRLVQRESSRPAITQRGRYNMEGNGTGFSVTIKRLKRVDAGRYSCSLEGNGTMWSEEVMATVLEAATVPAGYVPYTVTAQTADSALSQGHVSSSTLSLTPSPTLEGSKEATTSFTDTTIVIFVSVSLALLVFAIIPVIFYGHWRSTAENQTTAEANKAEPDYCEDNADILLTQTAVTLPSVDRATEASHDAAQYASIYQALDPTTLD